MEGYVVVTRLYVKTDSAEKARDIVRYELGHSDMFVHWPYREGMTQFDCDCEEVLTHEEFVKNRMGEQNDTTYRRAD